MAGEESLPIKHNLIRLLNSEDVYHCPAEESYRFIVILRGVSYLLY